MLIFSRVEEISREGEGRERERERERETHLRQVGSLGTCPYAFTGMVWYFVHTAIVLSAKILQTNQITDR